MTQDIEREALLPCPFCGGEATFEHIPDGRWSIGCVDADGDCMGFQSFQTFTRKTEAAEAWNRRALTPDHARQVDGEVADAFLVEWQQGGETWVQAHADEPTAVDQARKKRGTCTSLYRHPASACDRERERLLRQFVNWLERVDDEADDLDYLNRRHGWDDIRSLSAQAKAVL